MKYIFLSFLIITLSACSTSEMRINENNKTTRASSEVQTEPYEIGSVDTAFKIVGPDHKIEVGGVPDPKVSGITCFYSRAKTGGITGGL
jgi:catabolite regulation protein CreA